MSDQDRISELEKENERLEARCSPNAVVLIDGAGFYVQQRVADRIELLEEVAKAARQWADGIGNDSKCYDDICVALNKLDKADEN